MKEVFKLETNNLNKLDDLAKKALFHNEKSLILLMEGNLGTGKTTLTQKMASILGIPINKIKSPTYSLINSYKTKNNSEFNHLDLYRLTNLGEDLWYEVEELINKPNSVTIIEWPDLIEQKLLENFSGKLKKIKIEYAKDNNRLYKLLEY